MALEIFTSLRSEAFPDGTPVFGYYQGETYRLPFDVADLDTEAAEDITGWTLEVVMSTHLANVMFTPPDNTTISNMRDPATAIADRTLTGSLTDAANGIGQFILPADLYAPDIALNEIQAVPVMRCMVRVTSPVMGGSDEVVKDPFAIIVRPG